MPFHSDTPDAASRTGQLRLFLDGYGLAVEDRTDFVTRMIGYAIRDCADSAVKAQVTPKDDWRLLSSR